MEMGYGRIPEFFEITSINVHYFYLRIKKMPLQKKFIKKAFFLLASESKSLCICMKILNPYYWHINI